MTPISTADSKVQPEELWGEMVCTPQDFVRDTVKLLKNTVKKPAPEIILQSANLGAACLTLVHSAPATKLQF